MKSLWESSYDSLNDDLLMVYYFTVYNPGLKESSIKNRGRDLSIQVLPCVLCTCIKLHRIIMTFCMNLCGCVVGTGTVLVFLLCIPECIS